MAGMADWQAQITIDVDNLKKKVKAVEGELDGLVERDYKVKLDLDTKTLESAIQKLDKMLNSLGKGTGDFKQLENLSKELSSITTEMQSLSKAFGKVDDSGAKTLLSSIQNIDRSLSELSQNILNVNKNMSNMGGNTSGAVKQVENIGNAAADAVKQVDKLADAQNKLGNKTNISSGLKDAFQGGDNQIDIKSEAKQLKKEFNDAWNEAHKINSALDETKNTIASLSQMKELSSQFGDMNTKVDSLNSELANGKITVSDYKKEVKSLTSEYSKLVNIQQNREVNDYKNQQSTINGYAKRLESYTKKESNYKATLQRFGDDGWTSDDYLEKVTAVSAAIKQYESILGNLKAHPELVTDKELSNLDKQEKIIKDNINAIQNMTAAQKGYDKLSGEKELNKISQILSENTRMSAEARAKIQAYYNQIESGNPSMSLDKIHAEILKIVNAEEQAGRTGKSMFDIFSTSRLHQIIAQAAGMFSLYDVINVGKQGLQSIRELNTALTEMRKVSDETVQSLKNYQSTTFDTADAVGTTAKQIQNSTADWMRLGESMSEAATSAKDANILLNVSEFDNIDEATESLVSMSQAYKDLDKIDIIDVLNNIGNNYSISTDGLATALKDSASALVTANNDLNEAVSLTTAGNAITQDPSKVGAGLRTISLRLVGKQYMPKHTVMYGSFTTLVSNYIG